MQTNHFFRHVHIQTAATAVDRKEWGQSVTDVNEMRAKGGTAEGKRSETYYHFFRILFFIFLALTHSHTAWKINIYTEKCRQAHTREKSTRLMTRQTMRTMSMLMLSEMEAAEKWWRKWEKINWRLTFFFLFIAIPWHTYQSANEQKFHRNVVKIKFYPNLFIYGTYRTWHETLEHFSIFHLLPRVKKIEIENKGMMLKSRHAIKICLQISQTCFVRIS